MSKGVGRRISQHEIGRPVADCGIDGSDGARGEDGSWEIRCRCGEKFQAESLPKVRWLLLEHMGYVTK